MGYWSGGVMRGKPRDGETGRKGEGEKWVSGKVGNVTTLKS
jgi:hypothetical protein